MFSLTSASLNWATVVRKIYDEVIFLVDIEVFSILLPCTEANKRGEREKDLN